MPPDLIARVLRLRRHVVDYRSGRGWRRGQLVAVTHRIPRIDHLHDRLFAWAIVDPRTGADLAWGVDPFDSLFEVPMFAPGFVYVG